MERDGYDDDDYMSDEELEAYEAEHGDGGDGEGGEPVSDAHAYKAGYQSAQVDADCDAIEAKYEELQGNEELQELVVRDALELARQQGGVPLSQAPELIEQAVLARRDPGDAIVNRLADGRFRLGG